MKKLGSFFLFLIGMWLLFEFMSFFALLLMQKGSPNLEALQASRAEILGTVESRPEQALFKLPAALHPYIGTVHNPDADIPTQNYSGFDVTDYGFFDDKEPVFRKQKKRFIIGVFGGSVAWWFTSLASVPLIDELKKSPAFADKEIIIVRGALGAYKQPQQLAALEYFLMLGGQFDAVVNLDGFNEVTLPIMHNVPKGIFPMFPTYWHDILEPIASSGSQEWVGKLAYLKSIRRDVAEIASRPVLRKSPLVNLLWELSERILSAKITRMKVGRVEGEAEGAKLPYTIRGPQSPFKNEGETLAELASYWRRGSQLMDAASKSKGIEYFHFLQPNQYVAGSKPLSPEEKKKAYDPESEWKRLVELGYPLLFAEIPRLRASGVRFHDLTQLFKDEKQALYNDSCCHFNLIGNALLAKAIAKPLVEVFEHKAALGEPVGQE